MRWFKDLYDRNVRLTDERLEHFENNYNVSEFVFPFLLKVEARFWG